VRCTLPDYLAQFSQLGKLAETILAFSATYVDFCLVFATDDRIELDERDLAIRERVSVEKARLGCARGR
jgi:hypothetical protein